MYVYQILSDQLEQSETVREALGQEDYKLAYEKMIEKDNLGSRRSRVNKDIIIE